MKENLLGVVSLLGIVVGWLLTSAARKNNPIEDVETLKRDLAEKSKLVEDQAKSLKFLNNECNAYRKDRDEAWRREALLKKTLKEMRARSEYWREKYLSVVPESAEAAHEEEIVIVAKTEEKKC